MSTHRVLGIHADWVEAPFRSFGVQPLMKITLGRNQPSQGDLRDATSIAGSSAAANTGRSGARFITKDLGSGDRLCFTYPRNGIRRTTPSPFGIAHGFTFGDGTRVLQGFDRALLCPPKDTAMLKWFPNSLTTASGGNLLVHHLPAFFKDRPPLDESPSYLYGWLAGYFAADGCVAADGTVDAQLGEPGEPRVRACRLHSSGDRYLRDHRADADWVFRKGAQRALPGALRERGPHRGLLPDP